MGGGTFARSLKRLLTNFDTSWRFSTANETCQEFADNPGSLAIKICPQQICMPNANLRQAEAATQVPPLLDFCPYCNFSVAKLNIASAIATIQNRIVIFDSDHPNN